MVIQCRSCNGLLRCDPMLASGDRARRIRCPHCGRDGFIHNDTVSEGGAVLETITPKPDVDKNIISKEQSENDEFREQKDVWELEIRQEPREEADAMSSEQKPLCAKPAGSRINWVRWIAASFAVVLVFALFVNLILPGPTGHKLFGGVTFQEHGRGADAPIENKPK